MHVFAEETAVWLDVILGSTVSHRPNLVCRPATRSLKRR
jgi:hypothetical protein